MTIGWIESRYYPSAINYETGKGYHPHLFPNNNWKGNKYLWEYTGGLFQLFPYVALNTYDGSAKNVSPTSVFDPYYSIAYGIDLAYRLKKKYGAKTWFDVRLGWASIDILKKKPGQKVIEIEDRLLNSAKENNINPEFLYETDLNFGSYKGFKNTLKMIKS